MCLVPEVVDKTPTTIKHTEHIQKHVDGVEAVEPLSSTTETRPTTVISVCDERSLLYWSSFVRLPSISWGWSFNQGLETVFCTGYDKSEKLATVIVKTIAVRLSGELFYLFNGINISHCELPPKFSTFERLSTIIQFFDKLKPCEGITIPSAKLTKYSDDFVGVKDKNGNWRSKSCAYVFDTIYVATSCTRCRALKRYFLQKIGTLQLKKKKETMNEKCRKLRSKLNTMEKKLEVFD